MKLFFLMFLINSSFASSFNQAKEAAAALKKMEPKQELSVEKQTAKTTISVEEENSDGLNKIICPKVSNQFLNSSTTTLRAMQDLFETYEQYEANTVEFYLTLLGYDKRNPEHEIAVGKIVEIENGTRQKLTRAKSNYNDELKNMAGIVVRVKKCWSFHPSVDKEKISRFLEIFQKEKTLKDFKFCTESKESKIKLLKQQFSHTIRFYNKEINEKTYTMEFEKVEKDVQIENKKDQNLCKDFSKNKKYDLYFQGKYDHKTEIKEQSEKDSKLRLNPAALGW